MPTALANAYIQVLPSTKGLQKGIAKGLNNGASAPSAAGAKWGGGFASAVGKVIAAAGIGTIIKEALDARGTFEQLSGGVEKIFDTMDTSQIYADANAAYKNLGMSANDYLETINDVGAAFSASMGDEKAYKTAKTGLQAIADYASGTGKNVDVLKEKFAMITRSTSSYQSIADQFAGILPATSKDFLEQAQAAGILSESYTKLTDVPIDEYQQAVALMLEKGTADLGLTANTAAEATGTLTGSIGALKAVWENFLTGTATGKDLSAVLVPAIKNISKVVLDILPDLIEAIPTLLFEVGGAIVAALPALWDALKNAFTEICTRLRGVFEEYIPGIVKAWDMIKEGAVIAFNGIKNFITVTVPETVHKVIEFFKALPEAALQIARDFINNIIITLTGMVLDIYNAGKEIITNLIDGAKSIFSNLVNLGQSVVDKIKEGISNAWSGLTSWFENLWNNLFNRNATITVSENGATAKPYRTGLEYVPYDGYPAILHRGESVLTRAEAKEWREGRSTGGVVINQTINTPVQTPVELAAATSAYFRQARWAMI